MRREEFTAGFAGIGGIVGDQEFIGVTEQVDMITFEVAEIEVSDAFEYGGKAVVFFCYGAAKAVAGRIEISEKSLDILFRGISCG